MYNDNGFLRYESDELYHSGIPGMKWGFSNGVKNGKRIAQEFIRGLSGKNYRGYSNVRSAGTPEFKANLRPSNAYNAGANIRGNARSFRDSVDDTVENWVNDQKDFYKGVRDKIRDIRRYGWGKKGKAAKAKHIQNASYYKPHKGSSAAIMTKEMQKQWNAANGNTMYSNLINYPNKKKKLAYTNPQGLVYYK